VHLADADDHLGFALNMERGRGTERGT